MNNIQRIDVSTRYATIVMISGKQLQGEIFLQLHSGHLSGPERVGEALNSEETFLALETSEGVELLNLELVISVSVEAEEEFDPLQTLGTKQNIWLQTSLGDEFNAEIYINLPSDRTRVKDFLNQPYRFLPILHDNKVSYISRNKIMRVRDERFTS
jgi:hypothetical protein